MPLKRIVLLLAAAVLSVQEMRNGAVDQSALQDPESAAKFWSAHPAVELSLGMTTIAEATHAGQPVPRSALRMIEDAAPREPLATEPFLVRGIELQLAGKSAAAERVFAIAQSRDLRSRPAAFFLTQRYLAAGKARQAMDEMALFARVAPGADIALAPYIDQVARDPANWPALRTLFRANPALADAELLALARDPVTAPAVLALADPKQKIAAAPWLEPLLNSLVASGHYGQALAIWKRTTGVQPAGLIYDSSFADKTSPPPFNWSLTSSTVGLAERQPGGHLHVIFYGQEDGFLASELLILEPGNYKLSMQLLGDPARAHSLNWSIWCDKADAPISSVTLDAAAGPGWTFTVPRNCPAQWLKLSGVSADISQQVDVVIASLKLERAAGA